MEYTNELANIAKPVRIPFTAKFIACTCNAVDRDACACLIRHYDQAEQSAQMPEASAP